MITAADLVDIGQFNQPHGIKGEINATVDAGIDLEDLRCIVIDVDGIFVPFFVSSVRPRSATTLLVTLDDVTDEKAAAEFQGKTIYALKEECGEVSDDDEGDGFYAEDLIGYRVIDESLQLTGEIADVDDSTENVLFVVDASDGKQYLIPVAEEFIDAIDTENKIVELNLPEGLLEI